MFRPRVIPCLLLQNNGLVKTVNFTNPTYIGDPINAVKIFNDSEADELVFLDIIATKEERTIPFDLVKKIGDEAFMPFTVGGGIKNIKEVEALISLGAEKVVINTAAIETPHLISEIANLYGSQAAVVSIDAKIYGSEYKVLIKDGSQVTELDPVSVAIKSQEMGAGEIIINSIDKDGTLEGYDINLVSKVAKSVEVPVIALGGAGNLEDFDKAVRLGHASAVSAGSLFVYVGGKRGILINYPDKEDLRDAFTL